MLSKEGEIEESELYNISLLIIYLVIIIAGLGTDASRWYVFYLRDPHLG